MSWATLSRLTNQVAQKTLGGVSFSAGAVQGTGFLLGNSRMVLSDEVIGVDRFLTALTADVSALTYNDQIVVDNEIFLVRYQPQPFSDGTWSEVPLSGPIAAPAPVTLELTTTAGVALTTTTGTHLIRL